MTSISRILSGQRLSEYSADTQARVRKIAEEMGWRPNLVVQGMKTGKTHTFGVFVAPYDTFWTVVLYGIHDTLLEAKQVPLVLWPYALVHPTVEPWHENETPDSASSLVPVPNGLAGQTVGPSGSARRELDRINCLEDRRVDAIISWPLHERDAVERLTMLSGRGLPVVTIDHALPTPAKSIHIGSDEATTMSNIRAHLEELGHRRVVFMGIDRDHEWATRRKAAFLKTWPEFDASASLTLSGDDDRCQDEIGGFFRDHPEATAVVAATDHIARQVIFGARRIGKRVPEDLSIVGYGNDMYGSGDLPLTTIDQRPYEVGRTAAEVALKLKKPRGRSIKISTQLMPRASTRALEH